MGVQGLARLLKEEGWLPRDTSCVKTLWRGSDFLSEDAHDRIVRLPPYSTLALDGNGLAYYLHHVAYSRYFAHVTGGSAVKSSSCSCRTKNLSETQVTRLLPQSMPLTWLDEVTKEFVESLERNHMTLVVYWDGEGRRMKAATTGKRKETRDTEWSNLRQYCMYGVVPRSFGTSLCQKDWLYNFPMTRLLMQQVRFSLRQYSSITMVDCDEEADREVAKASANDENCYCVGLDSDFLMFPNTRYVPLDTLDASGSVVSGCVLTRAAVAEHLDLPSEASMIELGILMGNDYVGNSKEAQLDFVGNRIDLILDHLREQTPDYRVTSKLPQVRVALEFTRALYEFEDLSAFPLDQSDDEDEEEDHFDGDGELDRPVLPDELNLDLLAPLPMDFSVFDVVSRPLQAYLIDTSEQEGLSLLRQEHLDAFKQVTNTLQKKVPAELNDSKTTRPLWENVLAAYVIERSIAYMLREHPATRLVRMASPTATFDHALFHSILRTNSTNAHAPIDDAAAANGTHKDEPKGVERTILPIDEHEADILDAVEDQRVTIIHGETGCGKSSRVPVMLLRAPPPDPSFQQVKMFISQPRRIAAKSLVERVRSCEPDLRHSIALRMGHGVREYETSKTRAWFVTTGYLVRLLANHPEKFNDCSHLIIDEVHERSVDTDILCLLCRRLLETNSRIRLILMSATMAATLYQQYFGVPQPPIHVGARRFPIKEYYVEDLIKKFPLPASDTKAAKSIMNDCEKTGCRSPPSNNHMENLFKLSARMVMCVGRPGSSILIFVPGMNEIISITDLIEKLYVPGIRFSCYPIHSDVPFEEQMTAFDSPLADEVKVVIATNAAESSVTLPDVDHVICLGLCKQIMYNASSHRQMLMPAWISRASAIQRAGRTGRVRNGNVYRLYTRAAFEECMDLFEMGEMLRIPLDTVILTLKEMLQEEATPVLLQCLEPPDLSTIERSFKSLCRSNFITKPDDTGSITMLGKFVSSLGIDLTLGSLIGLGIQFGVAAEAVEMAAILSFPKTPWAMTSPLWHDPPEFNDITAKTYISRCHFDANLYSEPLAIMNMLWDYEKTHNQNGWAWHYSASAPRLRRLLTTRNSLRNRVADFTGIDSETLRMEKPPVQMEHAKVTLLRIIQVWVFSETMIEAIQASNAVDDAVTLSFKGDNIIAPHLEQVLDPERHPFAFVNKAEIVQNGRFTPVSDEDKFSLDLFLPQFENRFISLAIEKKLDVFWFSTDDSFHFFAMQRATDSESFSRFRESRLKTFKVTGLIAEMARDGNRRGRRERACGLWQVRNGNVHGMADSRGVVYLLKWSSDNDKKIHSNLTKYLERHVLDLHGVSSTMTCALSRYKKKKKGAHSPSFSLISRGECSEVSNVDLTDLFATPNVSARTGKSEPLQQKVTFYPSTNTPISSYKGKRRGESATDDDAVESSWYRPLLSDIPEGARLLSVLASGRRKEHSIRFSPLDPENTKKGRRDEKDNTEFLEVSLNRDESKISQRWRQFGSHSSVYVAENSVPASAMSMLGPIEVFACCANTLEVRGGGLRVEGLTLLPPGRMFMLLSFLSFGLQPYPEDQGKMFLEEGNEGKDGPSPLSKALRWVNEWDELVADIEGAPSQVSPDIDRVERILGARTFHRSCADLGESLVCHPDKVRSLCKVFDMIDGYSVLPWDNLDENPFTAENLLRKKDGKRDFKSNGISTVNGRAEAGGKSSKPSDSSPKSGMSSLTSTLEKVTLTIASDDVPVDPKAKRISHRETSIVNEYPEEVLASAARLFAVSLDPGESIGEWDLPSTNILCVIVRHYCDFILKKNLMPDEKDDIALEGEVSLTDRHWLVRTLKDDNGKDWFYAEFVGTAMPFLSIKNRVKTKGARLDEWLWQGRARPPTSKQGLKCVPPHFSNIPLLMAKISFSECESGKAIFFDSVEMALRMEAAFWLERQFMDTNRHWYQQTLPEMIAKATALETIIPREDYRRRGGGRQD